MDTLGAMRSFVLAVDGGSLAAASRAQAMTPSAVSKHIAALESELGTRLLQRTTRTLALTPEGALFYDEALALLARYDELARTLGERATRPSGRLRVTAPVVLGERCLAPHLPAWLAAHPQVEVELLLADRIVDLVAERFDVAVRAGVLPDSSLVARRLAQNTFRVCAAPAYLQAHGTPAAPAELWHHERLGTLLWERGRRWRFRHDNDDHVETVEARGPLRCNNLRVLHHAALHGRGVAVLPWYLVDDDLAAGRLVELFPGQLVSPGLVYAVYPSRERMPARVGAFVTFLQQVLGDAPPGAR